MEVGLLLPRAALSPKGCLASPFERDEGEDRDVAPRLRRRSGRTGPSRLPTSSTVPPLSRRRRRHPGAWRRSRTRRLQTASRAPWRHGSRPNVASHTRRSRPAARGDNGGWRGRPSRLETERSTEARHHRMGCGPC